MSSLYVHIPFCAHICSYCDFAKVFYDDKWADDYLDALQYEIDDKHICEQFDTIYIGGGTPNSLNLRQMERLFVMLKPYAKRVKEYSMEVNPELMNEEKLDLLIKYGINRLSIGVQTFRDDILKGIERYHTKDGAIEFIRKVKDKGIDDINVDLIYGLPHQTLNDVIEDIEIIDQLDISHVSIYSLILEDHTVLKNIDYKPLEDEEDAIWYDMINKKLEDIGFVHYEVSNYYRKKPSMHNLVYWRYEDYEGIGLGAHSLVKHYRLENTRSLTKYLDRHYLSEKTLLDKDDELFEKVMMGLRLTSGIDIDEINCLYHIDFYQKYKDVIDKYKSMNMMVLEDNRLKTTELGMKYLNSILVDFLE